MYRRILVQVLLSVSHLVFCTDLIISIGIARRTSAHCRRGASSRSAPAPVYPSLNTFKHKCIIIIIINDV